MTDHRGIAPTNMRGNIADNWRTWRARFENYLVASKTDKEDEKTQCAQLLHYIGEDGFEIYTTFTFQDEERNKLQKLIEKYEAHFLPKENLAYDRYKFISCRQQPKETLEQYVTELKKRFMKCKLENLQENLLKTVLTCGVNNVEMRERLLRNDDLTLDEAIEVCSIIELSKSSGGQMEKKKKSRRKKKTTTVVDAVSTPSANNGKQCEVGAEGFTDNKSTLIEPLTKCSGSFPINGFQCRTVSHYTTLCESLLEQP